MRTIELTKITPRRGSEFSETDDPTERLPENGSPSTINLEAIRCFYPRKGGQPGTRITFIDGGGFAVTENYGEVKERIAAAQRAEG